MQFPFNAIEGYNDAHCSAYVMHQKIQMEMNWEEMKWEIDWRKCQHKFRQQNRCQKCTIGSVQCFIVLDDFALPFPVSFILWTIEAGECVATEWIDKFNWIWAPTDRTIYRKKSIWILHTFFRCHHFWHLWAKNENENWAELITKKQENHDDDCIMKFGVTLACVCVCAVKHQPPTQTTSILNKFCVWRVKVMPLLFA